MRFDETLEDWYSRRNLLTYDEFRKLNQQELDSIKDEAIQFFHERLDANYLSGNLGYKEIAEIMTASINRFNYTTDEENYQVLDYWSTKTLIELLATGTLRDDCDGRGREFEGIFFYLCNVQKKDLYEAACRAENGEGHYVCWIRSKDNLLYQVENRISRPRTIQYMLDLGYQYWDYRPLTQVGKWFKPEVFIGKELYKYTQADTLEADRPEFSFEKAAMLNKSKTLIKEWFGAVSGGFLVIKGIAVDYSNEVTDILNSNKEAIGHYVSLELVGSVVVVWSLLGIYLRVVTNKDIGRKRSYDE